MLGVPRSAQTSLAYASSHTLLISLLVYRVTHAAHLSRQPSCAKSFLLERVPLSCAAIVAAGEEEAESLSIWFGESAAT